MCNEKGKNDSKGKTLKKGEVSQFGEALRAYQSWQLLGNCTGCAATTVGLLQGTGCVNCWGAPQGTPTRTVDTLLH